MKSPLKAAFIALCFTLIATCYFARLPHTVQNLDTGELTLASYALTVAHPPGFPVLIALEHAWLNLFDFDTVFFRAAFLNMIFACATLLFLWLSAPRIRWALAAIVPLAFASAYWHYAELPDAFMLNALFFSAIWFILERVRASRVRSVAIAIVFGLGLGNHPTLILFAPIVWLAWHEERSLAIWILAPVITGLVTIASYALLPLYHPDSLLSWGAIHSAQHVLQHALRFDYGTFRLMSNSQVQHSLWSQHLQFTWQNLRRDLAIPTIVAAFGLMIMVFRRQWSPRSIALTASIAIYGAIFLAFGNVHDSAVIERFLILPLVAITALAGHFMAQSMVLRRMSRDAWLSIGAIVGIVICVQNFHRGKHHNDFSKNTIVEDYAHNFLAMNNSGHPAVFIVDGDTRCNSMHYVQAVENDHSQDLVICRGIMFQQSSLAKFMQHSPGFHFDPSWQAGSRDVFKAVVSPNINSFDFYFSGGVHPPEFKTTYMALGRKLSVGHGEEFDDASIQRLKLNSDAHQFTPSLEPSEYKALFADYAFIHLKHALAAHDFHEALDHYDRALEIVPYCNVAVKNSCILRAMNHLPFNSCREQLLKMEETEARYF